MLHFLIVYLTIKHIIFFNLIIIFFLDPRLNNFILMQYYVEPFIILALYLYIIFGIGHAWMRKKRPYSLRGLIQIYNLVQIFANGLLFYAVIFSNFFLNKP